MYQNHLKSLLAPFKMVFSKIPYSIAMWWCPCLRILITSKFHVKLVLWEKGTHFHNFCASMEPKDPTFLLVRGWSPHYVPHPRLDIDTRNSPASDSRRVGTTAACQCLPSIYSSCHKYRNSLIVHKSMRLNNIC